MIKIENVSKKYKNKNVFDNFNLEIEDNAVTAILGESGVGKTTLLNIVSGATEYTGKITGNYDGVSFVFQEDRLIPFKTINENLEFVLGKGDYSDALKEIGLDGCGNKYPSELSGGMAKRVSVLRAFLFKSDIILMDEPFSGLDLGTKYKVMNMFLEMWKNDKRTAILVTHNIDEALFLSDRIIVLGEKGKILADCKNEGENTRKKITDLFCIE